MRLRFLTAMVLPLVLACNGGSNTQSSGGEQATTAGGTEQEDLGTIVAEVGDVKVYSKEFEQAAARKTPANGETLTLDEKKEVLQKLIEEKALYQEAKKKGVDQDPKVQKVMINTLLRQEVYSGVRNSDLSEDELRAYFDSHKQEFVVPEKAQIKRVLIRVSDKRADADAKKLAEELRGKIKANPDKFNEVATEFSEDPYKRRGGDLGFVSRDGKPGIDQAVVEKAFAMNVGEVSEVFKSDEGYNVILVANKREGVERTFEQMRSSVIRRVKNEKYREMYDKYVAEVSKNYSVKIDDAALEKIEVAPARRVGGGPGPMGMPGAPGEQGELDIEGPEGIVGGEGEGAPAPHGDH